jgi:hypothetical protein
MIAQRADRYKVWVRLPYSSIRGTNLFKPSWPALSKDFANDRLRDQVTLLEECETEAAAFH